MGAIPSKYDPNPTNPNSPGDGGGGESSPPTFSGTVPDVHVAWGSAPAVVADTSTGTDTGSTPPVHQPLTVDIGSIKAFEQTLLSGGTIMVDAYEDLKSLVTASQDIFGQDATVTTTFIGNSEYGMNTGMTTTTASDIQDAAKQFAAAIFPAEENTLKSVADSLEMLGQLIAAYNMAAQAYATADYKSAFPEPGQ
ncbi:hypothetical protein [Streptomyces sp. NPDC054765]